MARPDISESYCVGKVGYPTWDRAQSVADRASEPVEVYRCRQCRSFPYGHADKVKLPLRPLRYEGGFVCDGGGDH